MVKKAHISVQSNMSESVVHVDFVVGGTIGKRLSDVIEIIDKLNIEAIDITTYGEGAYLFSMLEEKYPDKKINNVDVIHCH